MPKLDLDVIVGHPSDTPLVRDAVDEVLGWLKQFPTARLVVVSPEAAVLEREFGERAKRAVFVPTQGRYYAALFQYLRQTDAAYVLCAHPSIRVYAAQMQLIWEARTKVDWIRGRRSDRKLGLAYRAARGLYTAWFRSLFSTSSTDPGCPFFVLHRDGLAACLDLLTPDETFWWEIAAFGSKRGWRHTEIPLSARRSERQFADGSSRGARLVRLGITAMFGVHKVSSQKEWNPVIDIRAKLPARKPVAPKTAKPATKPDAKAPATPTKRKAAGGTRRRRR